MEISSLYTDAGTVLKNPSQIGVTWAFCAVDSNDVLVKEKSGFIPLVGGTNNYAEFIAILYALEEMEDGWSGLVYSDSQISLNRIFNGWKTKNIPNDLVHRAQMAVDRLGKITPVLLSGHPTKNELKTGLTSSGRPVSKWNVRCDDLCNEEAINWGNKTMTIENEMLDDSSVFEREYKAKTKTGEVSFTRLDDLLEFIQSEMLVATDEKEIVVRLCKADNG